MLERSCTRLSGDVPNSLRLQLRRHPLLVMMSAFVSRTNARNALPVRPARSHVLCLWNAQSARSARHVIRVTVHSAKSAVSARIQLTTGTVRSARSKMFVSRVSAVDPVQTQGNASSAKPAKMWHVRSVRSVRSVQRVRSVQSVQSVRIAQATCSLGESSRMVLRLREISSHRSPTKHRRHI